MSLSGANTAQASFTANNAGIDTFQLTVSDGLLTANASVSVTVQPPAPGTPTVSPNPSTTGNYTVSWSAVSGATSYDVYESTNGTGFNDLGSVSGTSDTLSGKSDGSYYYKVAACENSVCGPLSAASSAESVLLPPAAPTGLTVSPNPSTNGSFTLSWTASAPPVSSYHIYNGSGGYITSVSGTSASFSGIADGSYSYYVTACNSSGCGSASSTVTETVLHVPGVPPSVSLSPTSTYVLDSYTLSWGKATGMVSYYEINGSTSLETSALSYTFGGKLKAGSYPYYVQACNASGCGGDSATVTETILSGSGCTTCSPTTSSQTATPSPSSSTPAPSASSGGGFTSAVLNGDPASAPQNLIAASLVTYAPPADANVKLEPARSTPYRFEPQYTYDPASGALAAIVAPVSRLAAVTGQGKDHDTRAAQLLKTPTRSAASRGIAITYGPPVYLAYANAHFEPASSVTPLVGLTVQYTYTATGYLSQLSNALDSNQVFWTANSADAFGQITQETYGNGVVSTVVHADPLGRITGITSGSDVQNLTYAWDALGNLTSRVNGLAGGASESFGYDILNRLTSAQVTNGSGVQPAVSYAYDALGDITYKSDTGSYSYAGSGPHAVTSVTGPAPGTYAYDADGNMTNRNGTNITWNSLNMPVCINAGGGTCTGGSNWSQFAYAPDKHRYYQNAEIAGASETTIYSGAGAFEAVTASGVTTYRYHLMADGREVAEVNLTGSGGTVTEVVNYVLTDHLGSLDVVTNQSGGVVADLSFSAWGSRREPGTWLSPVGSTEIQADHNADRYGFTHQEMLDNVNLIHMNGRVYDPALGRFLSVDPVFEFPTNTQSLNPYSYVLNNPLSMTDPTGYCGQTTTSTNSGTGETTVTSCQQTTATDIGSHIAQHGDTTTTTTLNSSGRVVSQSASGNGAGMGETAEISAGRGAGNGAQMTQGAADAQNKPTGAAGVNSPAQTSKQYLSPKSQQAIKNAATMYGYKNKVSDLEATMVDAATKNGIDPNILVGLAYKESSLWPSAPHGGLFQIQPNRQKDLGISNDELKNFRVQISKVAASLARAIRSFHGNADLGIASWTLGVGGTRRLYSTGGMNAVRNALLDRHHPDYGRVGPQYIDTVKSFTEPEEN